MTVGTATISYFKETSGSDSASTYIIIMLIVWMYDIALVCTFKNLTFSYSPANSMSTSFICLHGSDHVAQKCTTKRL